MSDMYGNYCACKLCGQPTTMLGTQLCDPCWELQRSLDYAATLLRNEFTRGTVVELLKSMLKSYE